MSTVPPPVCDSGLHVEVDAIQNARLYETVAIYASELEVQLKKLKETQLALEQNQSRSRAPRSLQSEDMLRDAGHAFL